MGRLECVRVSNAAGEQPQCGVCVPCVTCVGRTKPKEKKKKMMSSHSLSRFELCLWRQTIPISCFASVRQEYRRAHLAFYPSLVRVEDEASSGERRVCQGYTMLFFWGTK